MKHWFSHKEYKLADMLYFKVTMEPKDKVFIIVGRQGVSVSNHSRYFTF